MNLKVVCKRNMQVYIVNWTLLLMIHVASGPSRAESIKTYTFEHWCRHTVSKHRYAGQLHFSATDYQGVIPLYCKVTVTPAQPSPPYGASGKVMFYFEKFDLPGECDDANVTLLDGESTDAPRVIGAPFPLCGNNHTLTNGPGVVFNTTGESLTVELRWTYSDIQALAWSGFALNYGAYYEGVCGDDVISCQNGRCISKQYHCQSEIDTCGWGEVNICGTKAKETPALGTISDAISNIMSGIKDNAMYIGAGIALLLLAHVFGVVRRRSREHGSVRNYLRYTCCGGSRNSQRSRSSSISLDSVEMGNRAVASEPLTNGRSSNIVAGTGESITQDQGGLAQGPPSYNSLGPPSPGPKISELPSSSPPPPGVSGTTPAVAPPSYDDFLSNEDKYQNKH